MISLTQKSRLPVAPEATDTGAARFVVAVARALHAYGTPSHQIEETLARISDALNLESQFLVTPTSIMMSVGEVPQQLTFLERVESGGTNLEKLNRLSSVIRRVVDGELSTAAGEIEVNELDGLPTEYGPVLMTIAYTAACGTSAVFFGGGWREAVIASVIGLVLGLISLIGDRHPRICGVIPVFGACFATVVSRVLIHYWQPGEAFIGTLGGLIVLVPGYTLTVAMSELAHRHLVSGTARVTGAAITFLQMGLGLSLGSRISNALLGVQAAGQTVPVQPWVYWLSAVVASFAFMVLFHANWRDSTAILIGSFIALISSRLGGAWFGPVTGVAMSAWLLGCYSNGFARLKGRPAATTLVPGLLVLVPGSFGFRTMRALVEHDVLSGVDIGFSMTMTGIALVTGLFLANLTVSPRSATF